MKLTTLLLVAAILTGCAANAQKQPQSISQVQLEMGVVPCDTDSDCEAKNDKPLSPCVSDGQARGLDCADGGVNKNGSAFWYCEALTADGHRCKHHVHENGLLCPQHSAMQKSGKTVKTVD